jgi:hypothetical protein
MALSLSRERQVEIQALLRRYEEARVEMAVLRAQGQQTAAWAVATHYLQEATALLELAAPPFAQGPLLTPQVF